MKLELKHLAGYLPYGLKIQNGWGYIKTLKYSHLDDENNGFITNVMPILRPLSGLTKEIEVNGEKFVPRDILDLKFRPISKDLIIYFFNNNLEIDIQTQDYSETLDLFDGFLIVQKLLEWHFDIYGLIEAGLAIDINTLN
jgi:hypothetical protein